MITINILRDKIFASKRLTSVQKENAVEDLEFMETSKLYAERVDYDKNIHYYSDPFDMFSLCKSILGYDFWTEIFTKI
jgi:hypothetical protein